MIENQIPRYDILRKSFESRYYVVDSQMTGKFRFSYGVSNDEAILKDGTYVKCAKKVLAGERKLTTDNTLIGIRSNSYIEIKDKFYLVESINDKDIYIYDFFNMDIEEGTEIKLFSNPISVSYEGVCTKFTFVVGNILTIGDFSYTITEEDTPESLCDLLSKHTLVSRFGDTFYVIGELTAYYEYETYSKYPVQSGFLNIHSNDYIVPGDSLVLFNEDVRANNTVYVDTVKDVRCSSGYEYILKVSGLSGVFSYAQLRAFPAYKSRKLNIQGCKPSIVDICGDTVYGSDVNIVRGIRLYNSEKELTNGFEDLKYIAGFKLEPSDLWLSDVIEGTIQPKLPNVCCIMNDDGIFRMYIDSKIPAEFTLKFKSMESNVKISITDLDGNIIVSGSVDEIITSRLNKVVLNIKSYPKSEIDIVLFKYLGEQVKYVEYYFVAQEMSNERIEINGLHLNPVFRNYRELLAVIGRDKASEGRIAL